jgi:outer membrane protein TolC
MRANHALRALACCAAVVAGFGLRPSHAQQPNGTYPIDLPAALRLAGARNLDIQIAREQLRKAQAQRQSAVEQFFPWIAPGIVYHRRDGVAQSVPQGVISDAHFQSYSPGAALVAQVNLGDAIYQSLAAKQLVKASDAALKTRRQDTLLAAAQGYFELVKANALARVLDEAVQTSAAYQEELHQAVLAGIAFKGDELRVQTQTEQYRIRLEQARAQARVEGVKLAETLHLDSTVALEPQDSGLSALSLFSTNSTAGPLVARALRARPELKQSQALVAAGRAARTGAVYGPLIPSAGAQVFAGGLGGGPDGGPDTLAAEGDYTVGLSWRLGPGGLFDSGRINASKASLAATELADAKLRDEIIGEVMSSLVRVTSTAAQIKLAAGNLNTAAETLRLTHERKQYGVGVVLEDIQAQQALTQARSDYLTALAEFNQAQYALDKAVGALGDR